MKVSPAGSRSVTCTPVAPAGPLFLTVTVNVIVSPTDGLELLTAFMTARSACSAGQFGTAVPTHIPPVQRSGCVHSLPSLQVVPSGLAGFEQMPVAGLQTPAMWHWSLAVHTTPVPGVQTPARQLSACVQEFPSLHDVPSAARVCVHCASEQASTVHGLRSSQLAPVEHSKPTSKVRRVSWPRITSCAAIAPEAIRR